MEWGSRSAEIITKYFARETRERSRKIRIEKHKFYVSTGNGSDLVQPEELARGIRGMARKQETAKQKYDVSTGNGSDLVQPEEFAREIRE